MDRKYDPEERTAIFAENIVSFRRSIQQDAISRPIISQLVRSGTSIGANYCEANGASSKKDFNNKIHICKKEAQETKYWIRIIAHNKQEIKEQARVLRREDQELTLIFGRIISPLKN